MRILLFGKFGERFGASHSFDPSPADTPATVITLLFGEDADAVEALNLPSTSYILDREVVPLDHPLEGAVELAFLPPVSGG